MNLYEEHFDYEAGCASEAENCYEEARARCASLDQRSRAYFLTRRGQFVVCAKHDYYCRATDAYAGSYVRIVRICNSLERAQALAATHPSDWQLEDEGWFIYQHQPVAVDSRPIDDNDEIPF
jgi:hypothetical protein